MKLNLYYMNFCNAYIRQKVLQEVLLNIMVFDILYSSLKCSNVYKLGCIIQNNFVKCGKGRVKPNILTGVQRSYYYPIP